MTIVFHAELFMSTNGFITRATEWGIVSPPAGTQRTALKQLKDALRSVLATAAHNGELKAVGYTGAYETPGRDNRFEPNIWDRQRVDLSVPRELATEKAGPSRRSIGTMVSKRGERP